VYSASTTISSPYSGKGPQDGYVSPLLKLDLTKAFWIQNMVSHLTYSRWSDVYPLLRQRIDELQVELLQYVVLADENAIEEYGTNGVEATTRYVTQFSVDKGNEVHGRWFDLYGELFVRFRDYYTIVALQNDPLCGCEAKEPGLSEAVKKRIVDETGDRYKVATTDDNAAPVLSGESYVKQRMFAAEQSDVLTPGAEYQ
jgi:hypothetical protein